MTKQMLNFAVRNDLTSKERDTHPEGASLTRQEFAAECDINTIMERYDSYLANPMGNMREPMYVDFTQLPGSLMEAMEVMKRGEAAFMTLPAAVRREFDNDPAAFVDYASDPENVEQMREWGLATPKPVVEPPPVVGGPAAAPGGAADAPVAAPKVAKT